MQLSRILGAACLAVAFATPAAADRNVVVGEQVSGDAYVDRAGCIYVRAASGAGLVPRLTAAGKHLCRAGSSRVDARATAVIAGRVLVGPHTAPHKIAEARSIKPPRGFRKAWDDGRLNPYVGVGTREGQARMRQVWTDTVPRRLIQQP